MLIPLPLNIMNKPTIPNLKKLRRSHHLKLKDLSYILGIDSANLSRFEAGKPYSKALVGYHILFNLSIESSIWQVFENGYADLIDRCFIILESLENASKTIKNNLRKEGINLLVGRLTNLQEQYGQ